MIRKTFVTAIAALMCGGTVAPPVAAQGPLADLAQSHVDAHAPSAAQFDKLLRRDLVQHFRKPGEKPGTTTVTYEYLRRGATQSGVSFPKYYLWVTILRGGKVAQQGAVSVAAIERKQFEVTDFLSREQLRKDPNAARFVFPAALLEKIRGYVDKGRS